MMMMVGMRKFLNRLTDNDLGRKKIKTNCHSYIEFVYGVVRTLSYLADSLMRFGDEERTIEIGIG